MSRTVESLRLFTRVARTGSFSRAGKEVGLPQSSVSRTIASLEREVGAALLVRTTRAVTVTEAGAAYLASVEAILNALDEAGQAARGTGELRGTLRVSVSSSIAIREVMPRLPRFLQRHPLLKIDLLVDDKRHDLLAEGVDLALRVGPLEDSRLRIRKLSNWPRIAAASPTYLSGAGIPQYPEDLERHCLIGGPTGGFKRWQFTRGGKSVSVDVRTRFTSLNNEAAVAAAVEGMGIVSASLSACQRELESGALVSLLNDWDMGEVELHAVYPSGGIAKPAARAFSSFLAGEFGVTEPDQGHHS